MPERESVLSSVNSRISHVGSGCEYIWLRLMDQYLLPLLSNEGITSEIISGWPSTCYKVESTSGYTSLYSSFCWSQLVKSHLKVKQTNKTWITAMHLHVVFLSLPSSRAFLLSLCDRSLHDLQKISLPPNARNACCEDGYDVSHTESLSKWRVDKMLCISECIPCLSWSLFFCFDSHYRTNMLSLFC